jgi:hypothetical protein
MKDIGVIGSILAFSFGKFQLVFTHSIKSMADPGDHFEAISSGTCDKFKPQVQLDVANI